MTVSAPREALAVDEVSIDIDAPPERVWDLVTDVTAMGRWSPENYRCRWLKNATGPAPGNRFRGWNRAKSGPLPLRWATTCTVVDADRPELFRFKVRESGATWTYRFDGDGSGGTRLTETRQTTTDLRSRFSLLMGRDRDQVVLDGMRQTLERIKAAAEA